MKKNTEVNFFVIDRQKRFFSTLVSKLVHKMAIIVNPFFKNNILVASYATNDRTCQLYQVAKKVIKNHKISRVIAHNLPPFYVATALALKNDLKLQIDVEDYHIADPVYFNSKYELENRKRIMNYAFRNADVITYASEGIGLECEKNFQINPEAKTTTVINSFFSNEFLKPEVKEKQPVRLVWFSQNINANRGLEQVFLAAKNHSTMEFHLIGKVHNDYLERMCPSDNVIFHNPMSQQDLHKFIGTMDIGIALEIKETSLNRDICLTNKILAYSQAGLYVLATDTFGQRRFLSNLDINFGTIIKSTLSEELNNLNEEFLNYDNRLLRWDNTKQFSYEVEGAHLGKLIIN